MQGRRDKNPREAKGLWYKIRGKKSSDDIEKGKIPAPVEKAVANIVWYSAVLYRY